MILHIDKNRFLDNFAKLGAIGWSKDNGLQRISYSESYIEARNWLTGKMQAAGLGVRIDKVGNLFGRFVGKKPTTILIGSHLDAVQDGGIYDGALGVISALEVCQAIKDAGVTPEYSIEVVAFVGEEGEPLGGTFGSRAFAGMIPSGYKRDICDSIGINEDDIKESRYKNGKYLKFLELHIEQGPLLERRNIQIGIPSGIVGITRLAIKVSGEANHAGTTPMSERKDAMRSAAEYINKWFSWIDTQNSIVCNVGTMDILPGYVSVVPSEVNFVLEIRSIDDVQAKKAHEYAVDLAKKISRCTVNVSLLGSKPAVLLNEDLVKLIKNTADNIGLVSKIMPSGASHDSSPIAHIMPTGMIFVPSHNGISHSREEFTTDEDIIRGASLLAEVVYSLVSPENAKA